MADSEDWTPPLEPDPHAILHEAHGDAIAGRYALSLAKHLWFHEHALEYRRSLSGVRLSFALGYWLRLAESYPPAMQKLNEARDQAEAAFHGSGFSYVPFHDLASLNRTLGQQEKTADAFKVADRSDHKAASLIYHVAQPSLIRQKEYALCGKYLMPQKQIELYVQAYRQVRKLEAQRSESVPPIPETACKRFVHQVATLVALLIQNNRDADAQQIFQDAQSEVDDEEFKNEFASALAGNVPSQWP